MQRKWKRRWQRLTKFIVPPAAAGLLLLSAYSPACANPAGAAVTSGAATVATNGSTMTVNQTTSKVGINWQSFSIGSGETVNFIQPSSTSVALNRVVGSDASSIYGTLTANGRVYLINPNGILFAPGAQVNVGGLVASTLNITDSDFLAGKYVFTNGGSAGSVVNQGSITTADHVVLIGPQVKNEGVIAARVTALAAGNQVSLDFSGDKLLNVTVDTAAVGASAVNTGAITAPGGLVIMSTGTKDALLNTVVNNSGVIRAQTVNNVNGVIRLIGGTVTVGGTLDATAPNGGDGGFIETSGAKVKIAPGTTITAAAPYGKAGQWLLDPTDITIDAALAATLRTTLNGGTDVSQQADNSITVASPVSWTSANTLSLTSGNSIAINSPITAASGGLTVTAGGTITTPAVVSVGIFTLSGGTWNQVAASLPGFYAKSFTISSGATFIRALAGDGTSASPYSIADVYGLQGAGSTGMPGKNYTLANDIDASGTTTWNSGAGFVPIGNNSSPFSGSFDGNGHIISGLYINSTNNSYVGLFGYTGAGATISNLGLTTVQIGGTKGSSANYAGGLVGYNTGSISNCYSTGTVTGASTTAGGLENYTGGLAGYNNGGSISNSYSTAAVTGGAAGANSDNYVGGLVGANDGGLVAGGNAGSITNCYSTGTVTGGSGTLSSNYVGGLVGANDGGLVAGGNAGSITNSYSTGTVTGGANPLSFNFVGGLVGSNYNGGVVGYNDGSISNCYSTGTVIGGSGTASYDYVGGLVEYNGGTVTGSYWNIETSGQSTSAGGTGLTTGQLKNAASYAGWDIATAGGSNCVWRIYEGQSYPLLRSFLTPLTVTTTSVTKIYNGTAYGNHSGVTYSTAVYGAPEGTVTYSYNGSATAKDVGTYTVAASGLYSTGQNGYDISYVNGTLTILQPNGYNGAVITADRLAAGGFGPHGHWSRESGFVPGGPGGAGGPLYTIVEPGVNLGGLWQPGQNQ